MLDEDELLDDDELLDVDIDEELLVEDTDLEEEEEELEVTLTPGLGFSDDSLLDSMMLNKFSNGDISVSVSGSTITTGALVVFSSFLLLRSFLNRLFLSCFFDFLSLSLNGLNGSTSFSS